MTAIQNEEGGAIRRRRPRTRGEATKRDFSPQSEIAAALGFLLRSKREEKRRTLAEVCGHIGCVINTLRKYEAGATLMQADDLLKVARFLDIDVAELLAIDPTLLDEASK